MNATSRIIHGIEWLFSDEFDDSVFAGVNTHKIFNLIKKIDKLPIVSGDIFFSDDIWDLTSVTLERVPKRKSTFIFSNIDSTYRENIKFFIMTKLIEDKDKIQTIYVDLGVIRQFKNYLISNDIYSIEFVSLQTIKSYINSKQHLSPNTIQRHKRVINEFFQFYSNNYKRIDWIEINKYLSKIDSQALRAQREANKWDTIDSSYFNNLISCLTKIMNNNRAPINDRGIAALIILLSQTGLRNGEIRDCPINSLESIQILNGTKQAYYLRYQTSKGVKGNGNSKEVYTVMTELACEAYKTLERIYKNRRKDIKSNLLFVPLKVKTLPVTENTISKMLVHLCIKYGNEIGCINVKDKYATLYHRDISTIIERKEIAYKYLKQYNHGDTISTPRPHQFRVKLCNELINQGVSIYYVQRHMNHLTKEITLGYQRQERNLDKEKEYAESVMKMLVTGETDIMGDGKDSLTLRINEHIKNSKFNIATDLDEIVSSLTRAMPIRAKSGGICIKSGPIRECNKSDDTDDFYCAYGMCINLFHAYFMLDINYGKYTTLLKTIQYNQVNGFIKATEKEIYKLRFIVEKFIIPELDELNKEMKLHGESNIKHKHPQLSFFIDNFNSVYLEVKKWLN